MYQVGGWKCGKPAKRVSHIPHPPARCRLPFSPRRGKTRRDPRERSLACPSGCPRSDERLGTRYSLPPRLLARGGGETGEKRSLESDHPKIDRAGGSRTGDPDAPRSWSTPCAPLALRNRPAGPAPQRGKQLPGGCPFWGRARPSGQAAGHDRPNRPPGKNHLRAGYAFVYTTYIQMPVGGYPRTPPGALPPDPRRGRKEPR